MKTVQMVALDLSEIDLVVGGIGGLPSEPTFQDYIDLADEFDSITRWRLGNSAPLPPVY
ncbi:MAG: hypothetical protein AAF553_00425 [Pseudomonadota bacterium]